jgi:membrane-associated protease RseP (regulator of RpoE activity)
LEAHLRKLFSPAAFILATTFALSLSVSVQAQQGTSITPVEMKGQWLRGSIAVAQHENDGMIGIKGIGTEAGYKVETVMPGGRATGAGILPGDVIVSVDGTSVKGLDTSEALKMIVQKKEGEVTNIALSRNGETKSVAVTVGVRKHLLANDAQWQKERTLNPGVGQMIFGGSASVVVGLGQTERYPNDVILIPAIFSKNVPPFAADDLKFFVLDGTGQQLRHVSLDEIKYGIQLTVARNWKGGNYPPPPPPSPQRQYTISGTDNGNYTITNLGGGMGTISGTSNSSYTVTQQPDYSQLGYTLGLAIRQYKDKKADEKLLAQGNEWIASWERDYFKSQSPVVAGENRFGQIMYWTGSTRRPQPPYRVVVFLTDPRTHKEEHVTFAFGSGADKIKEEMANQAAATTSQSKTQSSLTNGDVVGMVKAGLGTEIIIAKIKATSCSFETDPTALKELKNAGVPDSVILAMVQAPKN